MDKTWHKTCFKCTECGMTLNMKTYKGYNKLPYCEAHIPKAKATAIADTPELKRIAENTKIQSNVKYHADFEKAKGKFTQVADDPETLRIKQNTKIISNVAYHGDLEKKAAMEKQREVAEVADGHGEESEYFSETLAAEQFSQYEPIAPTKTSTTHPPPSTATAHPLPQQLTPALSAMQHQQYYEQHTPSSLSIQHQQENTAAIITSSQAPTTHIYAQNNRHQQQHHMEQPQLQQHYQQPQALKKHYQKLEKPLQSPIKSTILATNQTSHLYPVASSIQHQLQPQQQKLQSNEQQQQQKQVLAGQHQQTRLQQPLSNSSSQLRTAILQNSHHPTGAAITSDASTTSSAFTANPYDHYDSYARPAPSQHSVNNSPALCQQQQQKPFIASEVDAESAAAHPTHQLYASSSYYNHPSATSLSKTFDRQPLHHSNGGLVISACSSTASMHNNSITGTVTGGFDAGMGSGGSISSNIGRIADYDPLTDGPRQILSTSKPSTTLIYSSESRSSGNSCYPKRVGSIADIDPANGIYGSIAADNNVPTQPQQYSQQMHMMQQQHRQEEFQIQQLQLQQKQQQSSQIKSSMRVYRALYDYVAQDVDEVSFREGDVIFEVDSIDSGWMTGRVERTGKTGMLPANYVEQTTI